MSQPNEPSYPAASPPSEAREARFLGLYSQRQPGFLMQRIRAAGGRLSLVQWRTMLDLAEELTPEHPLRLTTRQDLEFHGVRPEQVPQLQSRLAGAGITTVGACGDTLRNITACPSCIGLDLAALNGRLRKAMEKLDCLFSLPRKFKISLSACARACAKPWINDLGLVANPDGTFRAILAGSLGANPGTGLPCYDSLSAGEAVALAAAAVRLHDVEGDRTNRRRARLRHVRERLGDDVFRRRLDALFSEERRGPSAGGGPLRNGERPGQTLRLAIPRGELPAGAIRALLARLESAGGSLSAGLEHDLFAGGIPARDIPAGLRDCIGAPRLVACPAAHLCDRGLVGTWEVADAIRAALPPACDLTVALSGCPNNCSQAAVADIGLIGRIRKICGQPQPHFRLLAGGGRGQTPELGREIAAEVPAGAVAGRVRLLVERWLRAGGGESHSFGEWFRDEAGTGGAAVT